ncbi:hypothetical protein [Paenibacillus herberti]|uniref:Type II secretion system protein GspF domain-containing protein n=1 Tax=Paenibacillus herberti TaxID=1619309 RepID=A0A229NV47_9BACL|nr:hypothetical protein [Paenibacillus herberti]OXM13776.1 hypothetical protein CGZ75_22450 [Paenibacillus herberti]
MQVYETWAETAYAAASIGQALIISGMLFLLLKRLARTRPRWLHLQVPEWRKAKLSDRYLKLLGLSRSSTVLMERERLFAGCGWTLDAGYYVTARRMWLIAVPLAALLTSAANALGLFNGTLIPTSAWILLIGVTGLLMVDKAMLEAMRRARTARVIREIHTISTQLLYLQGSSLHVHAKLMRCVPYTRTIRRELQHLLGEWYHDAGEAIRGFKERVGSEEAMSFAETIDSLRLHEDEAYYELLRERIRDYKEKLEILKESRKESSSYVLFVLAGIPILYTFQVFIYPWVRESQKLFDSLN